MLPITCELGDATSEKAELIERPAAVALAVTVRPLGDVAKDDYHSADFILLVPDW